MSHILALLLFVTLGQPTIDQAAARPPPTERQRPGLWIVDTAFSPADIASAVQGWDGYTGEPNVLITFTESGRVKFERLQQGRIEQELAISVDGEIVSSPILPEIITATR